MENHNKKNRLIVIAEDSPTQAALLQHHLESLDYQVRAGSNGKSALKLAREFKPLLIISDILMPVMNGFELIKAVGEDPELHRTPVILLSTLSEPGDILRGLEAGAFSYLMKPLSRQYLQSQLEQVISNYQSDRPALEEAPIHIELDKKEYQIKSDASVILNLLFSSYESAVNQNLELEDRERELRGINDLLHQKVEERTRELELEFKQVSETEQQLQKSLEKFRKLVDHALVGIFIWSEEGKVIQCNELFARLLGYDHAEELTGVDIRKHFTVPEGNDFLFEKLEVARSVTGYETRMLPLSGDNLRVLMSAGREGSTITGMILDVTENRLAEERLKDQKEQLTIALRKAEESERLKTAFLANMSNEILNPLNSLVGFAELMDKQDVPLNKLISYAENINRSGNNLVNIIENIIDIARIETGEIRIRENPCFINSMMLDLYASFDKYLAQEKSKSVELVLQRDLKDPDFSFITEPFRLKKVFLNLLENAAKYTDKGIIEFGYAILEKEMANDNGQIQFYVKDTGRGIESDKLEILFDRFRSDKPFFIKISEGVGLDLPLSRAYVELLGGKIWCNSEPGVGTEFCFTLPFKRAQGIRKPSSPDRKPEVSIIKKHLKILIAEDQESNYILLKALLNELNPTFIWAKNGKEAVDCFRHQKDIDLILMDLRMPVMSGYEAVDEIRKFDQEVPIIVQTAFAREEDREAILTLGCNSFLTKPVKKESLYREIHKFSILSSEIPSSARG